MEGKDLLRTANARIATALAVALGLQWGLVWTLGPGIVAVAVLPLAVAAWARGPGAGAGMGVLLSANQLLLCLAVEGLVHPWFVAWGGPICSVVFVGTGVALGRLGDRVRAQVSALSQAERMLVSVEGRYRLAADGANDGLWEWDLASRTMHYAEV